MPCKHVIAVLQQQKDLSWKNFPGFYRNSPYFNSDEDMLFCPKSENVDATLKRHNFCNDADPSSDG